MGIEQMSKNIIDSMVSRFLGWKLPKDFYPDAGVSFKPSVINGQEQSDDSPYWPIGTNLFHAGQARQMFEHCAPELTSKAAQDVLAERRRQIETEGWTPEHDDEHALGEIASAAGCYALHAHDDNEMDGAPAWWPWDALWWKPKDARSNLIRAGALILAEIERLDRAEAKKQGDNHDPL